MNPRSLATSIALILALSLGALSGCVSKGTRVTGTFKEYSQTADGRMLAVVVVDGSETTQTAWIKIRGLAPGERVVLEDSGKTSQDGLPTITVVGHKR